MTIREYFKKMDAYNEVAKMLNQRQCQVCIEVDHGYSYHFDTYKDFVKALRFDHGKERCDAILKQNYEAVWDCTVVKYIVYGYLDEVTIRLAAWTKD